MLRTVPLAVRRGGLGAGGWIGAVDNSWGPVSVRGQEYHWTESSALSEDGQGTAYAATGGSPGGTGLPRLNLRGIYCGEPVDHDLTFKLLSHSDIDTLRADGNAWKKLVNGPVSAAGHRGFDIIIALGVLDYWEVEGVRRSGASARADRTAVERFLGWAIDANNISPPPRLALAVMGFENDIIAYCPEDVSPKDFLTNRHVVREYLEQSIHRYSELEKILADFEEQNSFFYQNYGHYLSDFIITAVLPFGVNKNIGWINYDSLADRPILELYSTAGKEEAPGIVPLYTADPLLAAITGRRTMFQLSSRDLVPRYEHEAMYDTDPGSYSGQRYGT